MLEFLPQAKLIKDFYCSRAAKLRLFLHFYLSVPIANNFRLTGSQFFSQPPCTLYLGLHQDSLVPPLEPRDIVF